jgi:glycosyltransferase involved in cell wall biosynthesis
MGHISLIRLSLLFVKRSWYNQPSRFMKVVLVHDYIKEYGGAERVLEALHELYPDSDVFTSVYLPEFLGPHKERFAGWKIHTSFLQYIPFKHKLISPFRLLSPWVFKSFDFSRYDMIIVSATGAYFPNTLKKKKAKLLCYCHTPPRYLYGYATAREWKKHMVFRVLGGIANHVLRMVDFNAAQNVDQFIANSHEIQSRIRKFYRKDAIVIYPPVAIRRHPEPGEGSLDSSVKPQNDKGKYYLAGGRLARPKHIDLIVQTCAKHNVPLIVFGKAFAGYGEELEKLAGKSVSFVGEVTDEEKFELMVGAEAYIMAAEDEDFGILPVEAMSVGAPVIAYKSGGVKETVADGRTGIFFTELTTESLGDAISRFEKRKWSREEIKIYAQKFSKERFMKEISSQVEKILD